MGGRLPYTINPPTPSPAPPVATVPLRKALNPYERKQTLDDVQIMKRKLQSILNKLTPEKFNYFVDKLKKEVNTSPKAEDDKNNSLELFTQLVFEKAVSEQRYCSTYVKLCGEFNRETERFRPTLLKRCQDEFNKNFVNVPPLPEIPEDATLEKRVELEENITKLKSVNTGTIKFIGELFKSRILAVNPIVYCLNNLFKTDIENFSLLMTIVGKLFETKNKDTRSKVDEFEKAAVSMINSDIPAKKKFALMEVIDLRRNQWVPRREVTGPKTIQEVHNDVKKNKESKQAAILEMEKKQSVQTMSRGGGGGYAPPKQPQPIQSPSKQATGGAIANYSNAAASAKTTATATTATGDEWQLAGGSKKKKPGVGRGAAIGGQQNPQQQQQQQRPTNPRDGIARNKYNALNDTDPKKPLTKPTPVPATLPTKTNQPPNTSTSTSTGSISSPPSTASPSSSNDATEQIQIKSEALINEFFDSYESEDVLEYFGGLDLEGQLILIEKLLLLSLEKGEKMKKLTIQLLNELPTKSKTDSFTKSFDKAYESLPEITIDFPFCPTLFGQYIGTSILNGSLEDKYLMSKLNGEHMKKTGSAGQIIGGAYKIFLVKGLDYLTQFHKKHDISLVNYLKPGLTEEQYLLNNSLIALNPHLYCKHEVGSLIEEEEETSQIIDIVEQKFSHHLESDPPFIRNVMGGILTQFKELKTSSIQDLNEEQQEKERKFFYEYGPIAKRFITSKNQVQLLMEVGDYYNQYNVKGLLGRILECLVSSSVVSLSSIQTWKESVLSKLPKKEEETLLKELVDLS